MKIVRLNIDSLYQHYNYNVDFNKDVTFIYGKNGCGKTTVLNIIETIITGKLYKLFGYEFHLIELLYTTENTENNLKKISITLRINNLDVEFNDDKYTIEQIQMSDEARRRDRIEQETYQCYFSKYNFLDEIKNIFNYVYLPLNRSGAMYDNRYNNDYFMLRRYGRNRIHLEGESNIPLDQTMVQVEWIIGYNYSKIASDIAEINDTFRNNILKSLLQVKDIKFAEIKKNVINRNNSTNGLQKTKSEYIRMIKDLKLISEDQQQTYTNFFDSFIDDLKNWRYPNSQIKNMDTFDLLVKYKELDKIKNTLNIAEKAENEKTKRREPIDCFTATMNEFIGKSEDEKKICIDSMGNVYFSTKYSENHISVQHLSSGEKQLMTFFANLIFNVGRQTSGIFVVDEPELSLHLSWQKKFVDKTLKINKNIQLIFATHAPEIIGNRRNKMFKLEKKYKEGEPINE